MRRGSSTEQSFDFQTLGASFCSFVSLRTKWNSLSVCMFTYTETFLCHWITVNSHGVTVWINSVWRVSLSLQIVQLSNIRNYTGWCNLKPFSSKPGVCSFGLWPLPVAGTHMLYIKDWDCVLVSITVCILCHCVTVNTKDIVTVTKSQSGLMVIADNR